MNLGAFYEQPDLAVGAVGPDVAGLQKYLTARGCDTQGVDGNFGPNTAAAVRCFQAQAGLTQDGVVGPATRAAMRADLGITPGQPVSAAAAAFTPTGSTVNTQGTRLTGQFTAQMPAGVSTPASGTFSSPGQISVILLLGGAAAAFVLLGNPAPKPRRRRGRR